MREDDEINDQSSEGSDAETDTDYSSEFEETLISQLSVLSHAEEETEDGTTDTNLSGNESESILETLNPTPTHFGNSTAVRRKFNKLIETCQGK